MALLGCNTRMEVEKLLIHGLLIVTVHIQKASIKYLELFIVLLQEQRQEGLKVTQSDSDKPM